jgi:hypothetical protein
MMGKSFSFEKSGKRRIVIIYYKELDKPTKNDLFLEVNYDYDRN